MSDTYQVYALHVESESMSPEVLNGLVVHTIARLAYAVDNGTAYSVTLVSGDKVLAAYESEGRREPSN